MNQTSDLPRSAGRGFDPVASPAFGLHLGVMASGTLLSIALGVGLSVLIARLLGPAQLAHYATVSTGALLLAQLSDLGLANAFAYYARHRPTALPRLVAILGRHLAFSCATALALVAVARYATLGLADSVSPGWFSAVLVGLVTIGTASYVLPVLVLTRGLYRAHVALTNALIVFRGAATLIAYAAAGPSWRAFIVGLACAHVAVVLLELWYLGTVAGEVGEPVTSRECYSYGLRSKWAELMKLLSGRLDLFVVAAVLPVADVGLYAIATGFRELGMTPLRSYSAILQNMLVDRSRAELDDRNLVIGSLLVQSAVSALLTLGAMLVFPLGVPLLYGSEFARGAWPAVLLFGSATFLSVAGLCWAVFNMDGRPGLTSQIVTISGLAGPFLVWALARSAGLSGAAAAGALNAFIVCVMSVVVLAQHRRYTRRDVGTVVRRLPSLLHDLRLGLGSRNGS